MWPGSRVERDHLAGLWRDYQPEGRVWLAELKPGLTAHLSRAKQRDLWRQLAGLGYPPLQVIPVRYECSVGMAVPPATVLLGVPDLSRSSVEESVRELLAAAQTIF